MHLKNLLLATLLIIVVNACFISSIDAQNNEKPTDVKLIVVPDLKVLNLDELNVVRDISIDVRTTKRAVTFSWNLDGPGKLYGDLKSNTIIYRAPGRIDKKVQHAVVAVSVTNKEENSSPYVTVFNLQTDFPVKEIYHFSCEDDLNINKCTDVKDCFKDYFESLDNNIQRYDSLLEGYGVQSDTAQKSACKQPFSEIFNSLFKGSGDIKHLLERTWLIDTCFGNHSQNKEN